MDEGARAERGLALLRREEADPRREPEHDLRGGPLPEHRRVLGPRHGDLPDPRRHVHPRLPLLLRQLRQARALRPTRSSRSGSRRPRRRWSSSTSSSRRSTATTSPTAAPATTRRRSARSSAKLPERDGRGADAGLPRRRGGGAADRARRAARRLQPQHRDGAPPAREDARREGVLRQARSGCCARAKEIADYPVLTKSGIIVGLGETNDEVVETMRDLRANGVDVVTIGQYLQPSAKHATIDRWVHPDEFRWFREQGEALGFGSVFSGPLVRSSYRADEQRHAAETGRGAVAYSRRARKGRREAAPPAVEAVAALLLARLDVCGQGVTENMSTQSLALPFGARSAVLRVEPREEDVRLLADRVAARLQVRRPAGAAPVAGVGPERGGLLAALLVAVRVLRAGACCRCSRRRTGPRGSCSRSSCPSRRSGSS